VELKKLRKKKGYTQGQIAEMTGVNRSVYARLETSKRRINVKTAQALAPALGKHWLDLLSVSTKDLVDALTARKGVETMVAEPYQDVTVSVNGPAIVLVVTD